MIELESYDDWKHCITVTCDIPLTPGYIETRLRELRDTKAHHTERFIAVWGEAHRRKVIGWFEQAQAEFA